MRLNFLLPVYITPGDLGAFLAYPYLFNPQGEWIGWVTDDGDVYSVHGHYVGYLGDGPRILRKRAYEFDMPTHTPLPRPSKIRVPATVPLAPMMSENPYTIVDILEEESDRLPTVDFGELREDMD